MPIIRTSQRSFAGGEIGPELYGRLDLDKYITGLADCRNFIVLPHGPVMSRGGSLYINESRDSTHPVRVIPFNYNNQQTYAIEVGHNYIRFHTNGATLLEAAKAITGISQANPGVITSNAHGFNNNDTVFVAAAGGMTLLNGRFYLVANATPNTFTLTGLDGTPISTLALPAYTSGGTVSRVYTLATTYDAADIFDIKFTQSADVMTLTHPSYAPKELKRLGAANWTLTNSTFAPALVAPTTVTVAATTGSGTVKYEYVVTAQNASGAEESFASIAAYKGLAQITAITNANPGVLTTAAVHGLVANNRVYIQDIGGMSQIPNGYYLVNTAPTTTTLTLKTLAGVPIDTTAYDVYTAGGIIMAAITAITQANPGVITMSVAHNLAVDDKVYVQGVGGMVQLTDGYYYVNTVPTSTTLTLKRLDRTIVNSSAYSAFTSGGTCEPVEIKNNLATAGNKNTINWSTVVGAVRYSVYKLRNGLYGYIGQTTENRFIDDNISADVTRTPPDPSTANPFPAAGDFPAACGYWDQRRAFGGTNNRPQNGWLTRPGTESNMTASVPTQDDDAISFAIKSGQQDRILHLVPLSDLLFLTAGTEFRLQTQNSDSLTPGTFGVKPQSYCGSSNVRPIVTANSALFVQARGSHVRELAYSWEKNAYDAEDLSIMAPHLFLGHTIKDMAYSIAPYQIAWLIRDDGTLLGLTYVPEHRVVAWHKHDTTNGVFESVCVIPENNEDAVYLVIRRVINGRTVRMIERLSSRQINTVADAFCVDCGLLYNGSLATVISGLWHLEGQTVSILADGAVVAPQVVTNGAITLAQPASKVAIGLMMTCDIQTLPLVVEQMMAYGRGTLKNNNKAFLRIDKSSGIWAGPSFDKLTLWKQRTTEPYGSPPSVQTGEIEILLSPKWGREGSLCVRQTDPLPLTLVSLALECDIAA